MSDRIDDSAAPIPSTTAGAGAIALPVPAEEVASAIRVGDDLLLVLVDGGERLVEGYFEGREESDEVPVATAALEPPPPAEDGEPASLGRLEEMFAGRPGEMALPIAEQLGISNETLGAVVTIGTYIITQTDLLDGDDDSGPGAPPALALLQRLEVEGATRENAEIVVDLAEGLLGEEAVGEIRMNPGEADPALVHQIQGLTAIVDSYLGLDEELDPDILQGRVNIDIDFDGDGSRDAIHTLQLSAERAGEIEVLVDSDADEDQDAALYFSLAEQIPGRLVAEVDFDRDGTVEARLFDGDGTTGADFRADRVELSGDGTVAVGDEDLIHLIGVESVSLADDGMSVLAVSDAHLSVLAGGAEDYALVVDGGTDDSIVIAGGGIHRTGVVVDGRHEYLGSGGAIHIDPEINVRGATPPLQAVLENLDDANLLLFGTTGLTDLTVDNLEAVRTALGAFGDFTVPKAAELTETQAQGVVDLVIAQAPGEAVIESADLVDGALVLQIDVDGTGGVDREATDRDLDGNAERVGADADADGTAERIDFDPNSDGTAEFQMLDEGAGDLADDGTYDGLVFADADFAYAPGTAEAGELAGVSTATLAANGATRVTITDEVLTALAGGDGGYVLTIEGDADDSVVLDATLFSSASTVDHDNNPATDHYNLYTGSLGVIHVDPDIAVSEIS